MLTIPTPASFDAVLWEWRRVHDTMPVLQGFCDFPTDLIPQPLAPLHLPCADVLAAQGEMEAGPYGALRDAMLAAGPDAQWRETYAGTGLGRDFMDRFGCYSIVGNGGAWASDTVRAFLIYLPANFWYPWHQHPAEELYFVVAGGADFLRSGAASETLGPGDTVYHASEQPHAARTRDKPLLALALWRNHLDIKPVLTQTGKISAPQPLQPA